MSKDTGSIKLIEGEIVIDTTLSQEQSAPQVLSQKRYIQQFVDKNVDYKKPWLEYIATFSPNLMKSQRPDELIPLYGTKYFSEFNEKEKLELYLSFIKINAEAQMTLEQLLLMGFRWNKKYFDKVGVWPALDKFSNEELYHSKGYRHFLLNEPSLRWKTHSLVFRKNNKFRAALANIVKRCPLALMLPGAKSETYSVYYGQYLSKVYEKNDDGPLNNWHKVNELHLKDEANHIPLDYEVYDDCVPQLSLLQRLNVIYNTTLFVIYIQLFLFQAVRELTTQVFPHKSKIDKLKYSLKIALWIVRKFPPYIQTRQALKKKYKSRKFVHSKIFSFIYW